MSECPCGTGKAYDQCCGAIIDGTRQAQTAEELMRSRYSAYVKGEIDHVKNTLTRRSASDFDEEGARQWSDSAEWLGLEIHEAFGGPDDDEGMVDFTASFRQDGEAQSHRERGNFKREDGQWKYSDGRIKGAPTVVKEKKVGRNEPCPCGSGKKFKKCCGR